jgi:hypothetical protein
MCSYVDLLHKRNTHTIVQIDLPYKPSNILQRNLYKLGVPFQVLLLNIVVTCVDTKYGTYRADICGDLEMYVSSNQNIV